MRWAVAHAIERLLVPLIVALGLLYVFRDAHSGANPYVEQIDRWLGVDALVRALEGRF
jgi:hypothetical protein